MLLRLKVLFSFCKSIGFPMLVITAASVWLHIQYQSSAPVFLFGWLKLMVDALILLLWYNLRGHQLYFYYNLGIRKRVLFSFVVLTDLFLFIFAHIMVMLWM